MPRSLRSPLLNLSVVFQGRRVRQERCITQEHVAADMAGRQDDPNEAKRRIRKSHKQKQIIRQQTSSGNFLTQIPGVAGRVRPVGERGRLLGAVF